VGEGRNGRPSPVDRLCRCEEGPKRAHMRGFGMVVGFRARHLGLPHAESGCAKYTALHRELTRAVFFYRALVFRVPAGAPISTSR
jgi:hypothetical protein